MPDKRTKFHDFALKSILFKGREDWYFCYLKSERIAHVMALLEARSPAEATHVEEIATRAAALPGDMAHLAAGEIDATVVLADIFALLSAVRLAGTEGLLHKDTAATLEAEYEAIAERLVAGSHPSPFVAASDFEIPPLSLGPSNPHRVSDSQMSHTVFNSPIQQKDKEKGHPERVERILEHLRKHAPASIKDIASTIKGVSEKTVQRELNVLIGQGLVRRIGERRWSQYSLV